MRIVYAHCACASIIGGTEQEFTFNSRPSRPVSKEPIWPHGLKFAGRRRSLGRAQSKNGLEKRVAALIGCAAMAGPMPFCGYLRVTLPIRECRVEA